MIILKKLFLLLIVLFTALSLSACTKNYTDINNQELETMLSNYDDYQFIDVRTSEEFYEARIPGFTNIDVYALEEDHSILLDTFNLDKDKPVVIMCNSGNRSITASNIFYDEGFLEVYNLKDGIQGWNGETE